MFRTAGLLTYSWTDTFPTLFCQWLVVRPMMELTAAGLCRILTCFPLGAFVFV